MTAVAPARALVRDGDHRYWFDSGREAIGVTCALKAAGLLEDRWFTEQSAVRGSYTHQALEYLDAGELVETSVDSALQGYVEAYRRFLAECALGPIVLSEAVLGDAVLGFAGTVDRVRYVGPHLSVIDIKSGHPFAWHRLQLSAYAELVKQATHHAVVRRWGLYLRPDGTYSFVHYSDRTDWDVFKAALRIAQFQRAHGWR